MQPVTREVQSFFWEYQMNPSFPFSALEYTVIDPVAENVRLHWHSFYEIGICVSGAGVFHFEGKSYEYSAGDVFLINNLEKHGAATFCGEDTRFHFFLFLPELFLDGASAREAEYLLPFRYDSASFCNRISKTSQAGQVLKPLLDDLWQDANCQRPGGDRLVRTRLQLVLAELCSLLRLDESPSYAAGLMDYLRLRPALMYIDANFTSRLNQKDVAALCYLSESRFRHLFREQMHMSFQEYVVKLRYLEAKRRIAYGSGSIAEAVREAGISNPYSFYQMFRENEGLTPLAWRNRLRASTTDEKTE